MVHKVQGSITVFLSLILVMVLALVGTLLDVSRINMAQGFAYRSLVSAVDTEFTKYCEELYEDYHIYMLGNGHSLSDVTGEEFVTSISEYLMYSFDPDSNQNVLDTQIKVKGLDLLDLSIDNCKVDSSTTLADHDAKIFQDQVAQYMKYYVAGEAADSLLAKLNMIEDSGETMTVVRKKNELDDTVCKIDRKIMKLMQEVEGITFKNSTLVVTDDYTLKVQDSFAKKFCPGKASPATVGINKNIVWDSLKGHYVDPVGTLNTIQGNLEKYIEDQETITALQEEIDGLNDQIKELDDKASQVEPTTEPTTTPGDNANDEEEPEEDSAEEEKEELEKSLKEKQEKLDKLTEEDMNMIKSVRDNAKNLRTLSENIRINTANALGYIDDITEARDDSLSALADFSTCLTDHKESMDEDTYSGMAEEYEQTKDYVNKLDENGCDSSVVGNLIGMKDALNTNKTILDNTVSVFENIEYCGAEGILDRKDKIDQLLKQYDYYSIKELQFDYTTLTVNEKTPSPLSSFSSLIGGGLLELVVDDTSNLSTTMLDKSQLVSNNYCRDEVAVSDGDNNNDLAGKLEEQDDDEGSGIGENLEVYEEECQSASTTGSTTNDIARKVLINEYGVTNFINLMDDINAEKEKQENAKKEDTDENDGTEEGQKETKLKYEQEYLVIGGVNDLDNVKNIVMRTIFMRTAVNYISLLSNSKCRQEARTTAIALVGFTGFAPLITITQQLILIAWGFEEGLVDTRALLDGNEVLLIKKADDFCIKYKDLLTISKETIKKKAEAYDKESKSLLAMSYNDYLRVYMLMVPSDTLSYRMMDLIQENMRLRYDSQFTMLNGIFGTKMTLSVNVPAKFLTIPFIKTFTGYDGTYTTVKVSTEYSY